MELVLRAYGFPFITILIREDDGIESSPPLVFLGKGALKIWSKFTREHSYRSAILVKLQSNFIQIALQQVFPCKFAAYVCQTDSYKYSLLISYGKNLL